MRPVSALLAAASPAPGPAALRLDAGGADDLGPLCGLRGDAALRLRTFILIFRVMENFMPN
jgi:hypothetical protein